jgi:hypothetical protein
LKQTPFSVKEYFIILESQKLPTVSLKVQIYRVKQQGKSTPFLTLKFPFLLSDSQTQLSGGPNTIVYQPIDENLSVPHTMVKRPKVCMD